MKLKLPLLVTVFISGQTFAFTLATTDILQEGWAATPLSFNINRSNCPSDIDELLNSAFALWNSIPSSSLKVQIGNDSTTTPAVLLAGTATDTPLIVCDAAFTATLPDLDADLIAGVGFLRGTSFRPITNGGLILNAESGKSANVSTVGLTTAKVVVAHEIGHVLGLGHTQDPTALMYYTAGSKQNLALSLDDQNGIAYLYPRKEFSNKKLIAGCGSLNGENHDDWWNGNSLGLALAFFGLMKLLTPLRAARLRVLRLLLASKPLHPLRSHFQPRMIG